MIGFLTAIFGGVATLFAFVIWYYTPTYTADEPRPFSHTIPVIGYLIPFAMDRRSLFTKLYQKNNRQPYSIFVAGRKHYVFSKPSEYAAVHRNSKTLDIGNFVKLLMTNWFGYTEKEAERYKQMKVEWHDLHSNLLLREENNRPTAVKYFIELEVLLKALDSELEKSKTKTLTREGREFVRDIQGVASTLAYFGRQPFEVNPNILEDLITFNRDGCWPLLLGAPRLLFPKPYRVKDRILAAFQELSDTIDSHDDVSEFIVKRHELITEKMAPESQAPDKFNMFFGMNSNSMPNAYCALLHVLSIPGLVSEIREELTAVGYDKLQPSEYITVIPSKVPLLRSLYHESLRVHINAVNIREVLAPTELVTDNRTWKLEKGGVVTLAGTVLHEDEEFHPHPEEFQPKRFMDKELGGGGESVAKYLKPFGGGTSYCPGRVFAEKQIIGFLSALVMRYDMEIVTENFVIPRNSDLDFVAACPPVYVEIRKRAGV